MGGGGPADLQEERRQAGERAVTARARERTHPMGGDAVEVEAQQREGGQRAPGAAERLSERLEPGITHTVELQPQRVLQVCRPLEKFHQRKNCPDYIAALQKSERGQQWQKQHLKLLLE